MSKFILYLKRVSSEMMLQKPRPVLKDKKIYYREDGGKWEVKLLSDTWNAGTRTIELECIEQFRPHFMGSIQPGERFNATCARGYEHYVGWSLRDEDGYDVELGK